jgi:hypothetical protein
VSPEFASVELSISAMDEAVVHPHCVEQAEAALFRLVVYARRICMLRFLLLATCTLSTVIGVIGALLETLRARD